MSDPKPAKRTPKVLLEVDPHSVVDVFEGIHERGERKLYTPAEADAMLAVEYGGRAVFRRVETTPLEESQ